MKDSYDIRIELNRTDLPDETALIENLILNNTLGSFLYTIANDIVEGRYNLEAGHTKIILNQLIETVTSIYSTVGSMDGNIQEITGALNSHTDLLKSLKESSFVPRLNREVAATNEVAEEIKAVNIWGDNFELPEYESRATESLEVEIDEGTGEEGLKLLDNIDIFDLGMDD